MSESKKSSNFFWTCSNYALGGRSQNRRQPSPQIGRVVSQTRTFLQRHYRRRSKALLERAEFINVPALREIAPAALASAAAKRRRRGWPRLVEMRQYRRVALRARIFINHRATQRCRAGAESLSGPLGPSPIPCKRLVNAVRC
jgi:hypothetical protein